MALTTKAQRALEEVKRGLYLLYGAEYFTEEEWIKIDGLIHKGNYVFTNGPPANFLEEQLISFDQYKDVKTPLSKEETLFSTEETLLEASCDHKEEALLAPEQTPAPTSSNGDHAEPPNETSAESSSDEVTSPAPSSSVPILDFSRTTTPVSSIPVEPKINARLPFAFTKEQLDEAKRFAAENTKAGHKKRERYPALDDDTFSNHTDEATEIARQSNYSSPAPTEREARISSWASGVDVAKDTERDDAVPVSEQTAEEQLRDQWQKAHNPTGPGSVASANSTKKVVKHSSRASSVTALSQKNSGPKLNVKPGTVLIAQQNSARVGQVFLDVLAGDHIRILKHVTGTSHLAENLRTEKRGQIAELIFKKPSDAPVIAHQQTMAEDLAARQTPIQKEAERLRKELDSVERKNAAEWDEVPVRQSRKPAPAPAAASNNAIERAQTPGFQPKDVAPASAPKYIGPNSLMATRFSILEDLETKTEVKERQITQAMKEEFGMMIDDKIDWVLKVHGVTVPTPQSKGSSWKASEPKPSSAKTSICWYWATPGKECRYEDWQCSNLHAFVLGAPISLKNGKPSWGAASDLPRSPMNPGAELWHQKTKTCYYWAVEGKCNYSEEDCKYLHALTSTGIAAKPSWRSTPKQWALESWKKAEEGSEEGELVLEEVKDEGSAWGEASAYGDLAEGNAWGGDTSKPPHVVALNNKTLKQAVVW